MKRRKRKTTKAPVEKRKKKPVVPNKTKVTSPVKNESGLTPMQEKFCQEYLIHLNATKAAESAGYSKRTAAEQGSRMLRKPAIQSRLNAMMQQTAEMNKITVEKVLQDLELTRIRALAGRAYGVAAKCSQLQGSYLSMFKESVSVDIDNSEMRTRQQRLLDTLERLAAGPRMRKPKKIKTG